MRKAPRFVAAALCLLLAGLAGPAVAWAAPADGVDDVVGALGLEPEPADYVVLVDTSGSMKVDGRYVRVRQELLKMLRGLAPDDRVSLLTFDTKTDRRFRGEVGDDPDAVLDRLPAQANGEHTDIGAAIAAGLSELERSDTRRLAALILITDGVLDAPGSPYKNVKASAWKNLATRAAALNSRHQVAAYAVSLQATTDARLLKKVLPQASEVAASQVGARFADLSSDLVRLQAADALRNELSQPIVVTWTGDLGAALADGVPADVLLEFASPYPHVPVTLTGITARPPAGLQVQLAGLPEAVTLEPNGRVTVPVTATVTGTPGADAQVGLTAKVSSPWRTVLVEDLGVEFAPTVSGTAPVPPPPLKLPPSVLPILGGVLGLAVVVGLVLALAWILLVPSMNGLLTVRRGGRDLAEVILAGRGVRLVAPEATPELTGLTGRVTGAPGAGRGHAAVRVDARFGGASARGVVPDGGELALGDLQLAYTSGRRRILEKIGLAPDSTIPSSPDTPPEGIPS